MEQTKRNSAWIALVAVLAFALVFAAAFALVPNNAPTAYAETVKRLKEDIADWYSGSVTLSDGDVLTGNYDGGASSNLIYLRVPNGATITLRSVNWTYSTTRTSPNISCDGDATIILEGNNTIQQNKEFPAISVRQGYTLTFKGEGSLTINPNGTTVDVYAPFIGAPYDGYTNAGNIVFESGTFNLNNPGAKTSTAIGGCVYDDMTFTCGNITICKDAVVKATSGGKKYKAIGNCGTITINDYVFPAQASPFEFPFSAETIESYINAIPATVTYTASCKSAIDTARTYYDCTTEAEQAEVTNYDKLVAAELNYAIAAINAIPNPVVYTAACKTKIDGARSAYNQLSDENKANFDAAAYNKLTTAEATYATLKEQVDDTISEINAIGEVAYTAESKGKIDAARSAYDALANAQKAAVTNYATLTEAEARYAQFVAAADVDEKIDAIGTVDLTAESKGKIDAARAAYDALNAEGQALVTKYATLTAAESAYATLKNVADLIDAIGEVAYTVESKGKIDDARAAYDALTDEEQALILNYDVLTAAEARYNNLKALAEIEDIIDAIGEVEYTAESKEKIDAARTAFEYLTDAQKETIANYGVLTSAEAAYVDLMIGAIGEVEFTSASEEKITAARTAYDALAEESKEKVTALATLETAEATYSELQAAYDVEMAAQVDDYIDAIGEVTYSNASYHKIFETARPAYNKLTDAQKALVTKLDTLTAAETRYNGLKAANGTVQLIDAIGEVQNNSGVEGKIAAAREAYDALNDDVKDFVENYAVLTDAEATFVDFDIDDIGEVDLSDKCADNIEYARTAYDALTDEAKAKVTKLAVLEAAEKSYADLVAADAVKTLIDDIGTVEYTAESKAKIDAAKAAFDTLSADQRNLLNNAYKLNNAVQKYRILETTALIDAIGEVAYTAESKAKIDVARAAYDALGAKLQPAIENADQLTAAEAAYKALEDETKANAVKALIEAIGTVEYTEDSKEKIDAAKEAYDALTDDQKALLEEDAPTIETAEATYTILHNNNLAAANVINLINAIGTVEYTAESKGKIDAAKAAYDALTPEQKVIVNDTTTIPTAETTYADLEDQAKAQIVIDKISAIGGVKYPDSKDLIQEARTAYDELTLPQKEFVGNYEVLTAAETTYAALETEANKRLSGGAIAGIVIGCFFGLIIIAFIVLLLLYKRDKKREDDKKLIKVPFINKVMAKAEVILGIIGAFIVKIVKIVWAFIVKIAKIVWAFIVKVAGKIKALWNKLFKKNGQPAAEGSESPAEDVPAEDAATDPKDDNE